MDTDDIVVDHLEEDILIACTTGAISKSWGSSLREAIVALIDRLRRFLLASRRNGVHA